MCVCLYGPSDDNDNDDDDDDTEGGQAGRQAGRQGEAGRGRAREHLRRHLLSHEPWLPDPAISLIAFLAPNLSAARSIIHRAINLSGSNSSTFAAALGWSRPSGDEHKESRG